MELSDLKPQNAKILFGLKIRRLRQQKGLSFAELSEMTGMSLSYLNEIEKGKKFPKEDKIKALAEAFNTRPKDLTSAELSPILQPVGKLLRSNFLNELPLDLFGIELNKVVEMISKAPARVGAFISTLLEISRNYAFQEENFYLSALRSFAELHNNYFEDIEKEVDRFCKIHELPKERPLSPEILKELLQREMRYKIEVNGLKAYPEFQELRSIFIAKEKKLLLHPKLNGLEQTFQYGKELGFQFLSLKERAFTSSLIQVNKFEEVLNQSKANYFSVALMIPQAPFIKDLQSFFSRKSWDGETFIGLQKKYGVSAEMFYQRMTNLLPSFFGIDKLFFLRFIHDPQTSHFDIDRELHINSRNRFHANHLLEHYCRHLSGISLLEDMKKVQKDGILVDTMVKAQRSHYNGSEEEYLCLTISRPGNSFRKKNVSVTLGFPINQNLEKKIAFLEDPAIQKKEVSNTCERCPLTDCTERVAAPLAYEQRQKQKQLQKQLENLL